MKITNQINRTPSPDVINPDKMREISQYLGYKSYEEMEQKFAPTVWAYNDANSQEVHYTLERPENIPDNMLTAINLNEHGSLFEMLLAAMDSKKSQGVLNSDFNLDTLLEMISPQKIREDIKALRKKI